MKSREELDMKSKGICESTVEYIENKSFKTIAIYESMSDEVFTESIISKLREIWYTVVTPQVISETEMIFIDEKYEIHEEKIDLMLIPGRAFSRAGKRLGRGKGYYDRYLSKKVSKNTEKIGVCFDFQIKKDIPTEKHDIRMDNIITNT